MINIKENRKILERVAIFLLILLTFAIICLHIELKREKKSGCFIKECSLNEWANSDGVNISEELSDILDRFTKILPQGIPTDKDELSESVGIEAVINSVINSIQGEGSSLLSFFFMAFGIASLFLAFGAVSETMGALSPTVMAGVSVMLSLPLFLSLSSLILSVTDGLAAASEFFGGLIPLVSAVSCIGGAVSTAAAEASGMGISLAFVSQFLTSALMPLVLIMFSLSLVSSSFGTGFSPLSSIRSLFLFLLGAATTVIVATLALQTALTSSADSLAMRGVKYAVSGMLPIVGGTVSGALSTLSSGAHFVASTMGTAALVAVASMLGAPLIQLLLYRLSMRAGLGLLSFSDSKFGQRIFSSLQSALDSLIAVLSTAGVIYALEIIIFMRYGVVRL